jgi:hypothetical protein
LLLVILLLEVEYIAVLFCQLEEQRSLAKELRTQLHQLHPTQPIEQQQPIEEQPPPTPVAGTSNEDAVPLTEKVCLIMNHLHIQ